MPSPIMAAGEAARKVCPIMTRRNGDGEGIAFANCLTDRCMFWEWISQEQTIWAEQRDSPKPGGDGWEYLPYNTGIYVGFWRRSWSLSDTPNIRQGHCQFGSSTSVA